MRGRDTCTGQGVVTLGSLEGPASALKSQHLLDMRPHSLGQAAASWVGEGDICVGFCLASDMTDPPCSRKEAPGLPVGLSWLQGGTKAWQATGSATFHRGGGGPSQPARAAFRCSNKHPASRCCQLQCVSSSPLSCARTVGLEDCRDSCPPPPPDHPGGEQGQPLPLRSPRRGLVHCSSTPTSRR